MKALTVVGIGASSLLFISSRSSFEFCAKQGCIKFLIKSLGEEYKGVKRGREYLGCGENITWKKGEALSVSYSL